jgi:hypothetical protein
LATTGVGSLPHLSVTDALADVLAFCPDYPYWPQLPRLSWREDMYRQFSAGLPGLTRDGDRSTSGRIAWRHDDEARRGLGEVYEDVLAGVKSLGNWAVPREDAAGLYALDEALTLSAGARGFAGLKGEITGPISLGLAVTDENGRALLYQEDLMDGVARALALRARWQEDFLAHLAGRAARGGEATGLTLMSVDEPYLGTFGSAYFPYRPETVLNYLEIFAATLRGIWGVHCCANTDWEFVMASPVRFLSFDAYSYGERLVLYPEAVRRFLDGGNSLVWGIVPTATEDLAAEDGPSLTRRLVGHFETLVARGVSERALARQSMVTPACGLAGLSVEGARRAMGLAAAVSEAARLEFPGLDDRGRRPNLEGWR